jgi:hypothetical protein
MAMMDAGVPIKSPIAGVAMGLLLDEVSDQHYTTHYCMFAYIHIIYKHVMWIHMNSYRLPSAHTSYGHVSYEHLSYIT